jgi:hypothetical protein
MFDVGGAMLADSVLYATCRSNVVQFAQLAAAAL